MKLIIKSFPDIWTEDSGCSKIAEVSDDVNDVFVRLISYRNDKNHAQIEGLINPAKRVIITIETEE